MLPELKAAKVFARLWLIEALASGSTLLLDGRLMVILLRWN